MTLRISHRSRRLALLAAGLFAAGVASSHAREAPCMGESLGEGRAVSVVDGRTLRLQDGREVRLAGVEDSISGLPPKPEQRAALETLVSGRDLALHGSRETDRYDRLVAFVRIQGQDAPVQSRLVGDGHLIVTGTLDDADCIAHLRVRETRARAAKRGIWSEPAALKNTEMAGDILAVVGQFVVAEGRVQSVREAGATLYINFGRRWTQDFAVTISRRNMAAFEAAGVPLKSLERRRVRVRGWVEQRGGPRIHASWAGQIEVAGH
jgi:endonuclease YncB( thermonuclease family)